MEAFLSPFCIVGWGWAYSWLPGWPGNDNFSIPRWLIFSPSQTANEMRTVQEQWLGHPRLIRNKKMKLYNNFAVLLAFTWVLWIKNN